MSEQLQSYNFSNSNIYIRLLGNGSKGNKNNEDNKDNGDSKDLDLSTSQLSADDEDEEV